MPSPFEDEGSDIQRMPGTRRASHTTARSDPTVHTLDHPFCYDPTCTCHVNQEVRARVQAWLEQGFMTDDEASAYLAGRTL